MVDVAVCSTATFLASTFKGGEMVSSRTHATVVLVLATGGDTFRNFQRSFFSVWCPDFGFFNLLQFAHMQIDAWFVANGRRIVIR